MHYRAANCVQLYGLKIRNAEFRINEGAYQPMDANDGHMDAVTEEVYNTLPAFNAAGVYSICVRGTDELSNTGAEECSLVAVYDPMGGYVTGGGWIDSPAGACQLTAACASTTGKANVGFVSKYQNGATIPSGNTNFVFKSGAVHFQSDVYQWLVISGAKASYRGSGSVNGRGNYGFQINVIDGALAGNTHQDLFRIKIWDISDGHRVVYDNETGKDENDAPSTAISSGSIVIHKQ